jgi:hypothetical protein
MSFFWRVGIQNPSRLADELGLPGVAGGDITCSTFMRSIR